MHSQRRGAWLRCDPLTTFLASVLSSIVLLPHGHASADDVPQAEVVREQVLRLIESDDWHFAWLQLQENPSAIPEDSFLARYIRLEVAKLWIRDSYVVRRDIAKLVLADQLLHKEAQSGTNDDVIRVAAGVELAILRRLRIKLSQAEGDSNHGRQRLELLDIQRVFRETVDQIRRVFRGFGPPPISPQDPRYFELQSRRRLLRMTYCAAQMAYARTADDLADLGTHPAATAYNECIRCYGDVADKYRRHRELFFIAMSGKARCLMKAGRVDEAARELEELSPHGI